MIEIRHSIWFAPTMLLSFLALYQFAMPVLLQYKIKDRRIEIWTLWIIPIACIPFDDIEIIKVAGAREKAPWQFIARYVSRPFSTQVYIKTGVGLIRKFLITPGNPEDFVLTILAAKRRD